MKFGFILIIIFSIVSLSSLFWYHAHKSNLDDSTLERESGPAKAPLVRSEILGPVASGTIFSTMLDLSQLQSNLPPSDPYILTLTATGSLIRATPVTDTAIDYRPHTDGTHTIGHFNGTLFNKEGSYHWIDSKGNLLHEFRIMNASSTDVHGITRLKNGNFIIPSYKLYNTDESFIESYLIEEQTPTGEVVMVWDSMNHVGLHESNYTELRTEWIEAGVNDYFHGNSVAETIDGHLLISGRHTNSIIKIHRTTGDIIWRLGGHLSDFKFLNDPLNGFSHQHSVHELPNGNILLYDNGNLHDIPQTRVVEYELNTQTMTAKLVWSYSSDRFTYATGATQRLPNGNTLIGWGLEENMSSSSPRITEVTPTGEVVLNIYYPDNVGFYNVFKLDVDL